MNEKMQSRLYLLTFLACDIWLIQSIISFVHDGTIMHWSSLIFIACIAIVICYTGYQGWTLYTKTRESDEDDNDNSDEE
ncbi:hypothetical protein EJ419_04515 [Alloscardovia theropitheci]|uniref:Uncharacterized protein n=1 Tax=Alloscardovia theropitheci TaxID=2496842 RepID=A0A4R0QPX1_9BIFI|nr:hypothetical protein [Alloscardovia theropitheci]TCD54304.1 hypothetical protein EJ419_04515 [Alloscardovia theropitheci]